MTRRRRLAEKVTARVGVAVDTHRPRRGPLARPSWWLADVLIDLSLSLYTRYERPWVRWVFTVQSHRRQPGWGYNNGLHRGGPR